MDTDDDAVGSALAALSRFLLSEESLESVLQRVVEVACAAVPGCSHGGVSLVREGRGVTAAATDQAILELDAIQHAGGGGPALDAIGEAAVQRIDDTTDAAAHLSTFGAAAQRLGLGSVLCLPLVVGGQAIGSLNLYGDRPGAFGPASEAIGTRLAEQAAVAVANARVHQDTVDVVAQLTEALHSRAVIDQAKGILMAQRACSADEAFEVLRASSQSRNEKVRAIASELVRRTTEGRSTDTPTG